MRTAVTEPEPYCKDVRPLKRKIRIRYFEDLTVWEKFNVVKKVLMFIMYEVLRNF